ncbi:cation-translocating P-type ATPase [Candidatus Micrarchaeota archaeon]|nr:cation-translocating P-type ATPase [Candidatus Micrarchaeota archaeon]
MDWHALSPEKVLKHFSVGKDGLGEQEAAERLRKEGPNKLKEKPPKPWYHLLLAQFNNFLIWILLLAAVISLALGEMLDGVAILVIVLVFSVFGFYQESRAEQAISALKRMAVLQAVVLRDGVKKQVDASELVPGDVVELSEGAKVPADCRIVQEFDLMVEEAALTGESLPVSKGVEAIAQKTPLAERANMVFLGTAVVRGRGLAVVVATGMKTELGKIAEMVQDVKEPPTPLQVKLEELGRTLGSMALAAVLIILVVGSLRGIGLFDMFLTSVALAVAAVPEGLPAVVTITLAVGVTRMAKRNSLIRKMPAVETLGSTTVICTDKTGTLTKNEMTVRKLFVDSEELQVSGSGYSTKGEISGRKGEVLDLLLKAALLCNSASLQSGAVGDPTELALVVLAEKAGVGEASRKQNPLVREFPFTSERKMMSTINTDGSRKIMFSKGAPEVLIDRCSWVMEAGKKAKMTPLKKKEMLEKNEYFASDGLRVLGFACKDSKLEDEDELTWLGLAAMNDPPREEVKAAIASCSSAGIRVVVITGDNPLTAKSVARELGLPCEKVFTGSHLDSLPDFSKVVLEASVFARVSPEHKLKIVRALKRHGHVVAVTGDGVNDAPAIKAGDIGVAMGITGTDVTKETSDMIITDDNFASIVSAVEEGRVVYDNIVKSVNYLISCNVGEVLTVLFALLSGLGNPLAPLQILWMNLATDLLPAASLSVDPCLPDAMRKAPRKQNEPVFTKVRVLKAVFVGSLMMIGTLLLYSLFLKESPVKAATVAFTALIFFQMFFALSSRSEKHTLFSLGVFRNVWLWAAIAVSVLLQIVVVQWSVLQPFFQTTDLALMEWGLCVAVASSVFIVVESLKALGKW